MNARLNTYDRSFKNVYEGGKWTFHSFETPKRHSFIKVIKLRVPAYNPHNMATLVGNMYLLKSRIFTLLTYSQSLSCMYSARVDDLGSGPPWKISKLHVFLRILGWTPCKVTKLPNQHLMLGHHRPTS